jgi:hypothetical protein
VITEVDHLILAIDRDRHAELSSRLHEAGFVHADAGAHPGGTANENVAFAGGAFLELLFEQSPGSGPAAWFGETPRLQGIGFSTSDFARDSATFLENPGAWDEIFAKVLDDGTKVSSRAAGPVPRNEFYVFCMARAAPPWRGLGATPRLVEVRFTGREHGLWRERFSDWFSLRPSGDDLLCGDVTFGFEDGPHPQMRGSLTFAVDQAAGVIPISGGTIELVER